jgi:calcium-dependent protein kinase
VSARATPEPAGATSPKRHHSFSDLVKEDIFKKLQKSSKCSNTREKLLRINGFVQRRIIHDYPYTDDYTVGEVVGRGASGELYHATLKENAKWTAAQKDVVLKTLTKKDIPDTKLEELVAETEVGLILDHPSICRLLRVYETPAAVTLVLEYCSGGDLYDRFTPLGKYSEPMAQVACAQMLTALRYLQSQNVVHRDVKLENWLYASTEASSPLCITDFGFATVHDGSVDPPLSKMMGSPYYVAPEIFSESYGYKVDMWSTGVVLYMLLSGNPPFRGKDNNEICGNVLTAELALDEAALPGVSDEARDFLRCVLNRDVAARPGPSEAAAHPWLATVGRATLRLPRDSSVDSLLDFADQPQLRRAALVMMGGGASNQMFRDAQGAFLDLDLTGSGTISRESFERHLLERDPDLDENVIAKTFSRLDVHKNGDIHYSEFLAAYDQIALAENDDAISRAFSMFDTDKSGFITKENLEEVFTGKLSREHLEQLDFERILADAGCPEPDRGMGLDDFADMVRNPRPVDEAQALAKQISRKPSNESLSRGTASTTTTTTSTASPTSQSVSVRGPSTTSVPRTVSLHHDTLSRHSPPPTSGEGRTSATDVDDRTFML